MDAENIYKATKLLDGRIKDRKEELKKNIVKGALDECSEQFSVGDINTICGNKFDVRLNRYTIINSLSEFENVYVERMSNKEYKIITRPDIEDTESQIEPVWHEYKEFLHLYENGIDPQQTMEIKPLFISFFRRFFINISESIEKLNKYQEDTIYTNYSRTEEILDEIVDNSISSKQKSIFRESVFEYIKDPGEELLEFTETFYRASLNYDILKKDAEIVDFPSLPENNKVLFLDTNVIVLLLAESDKKHNLAKSLCKRSIEMGFEIYYISRTAEEVDDLIGGTEYELNNLHLLGRDKQQPNQLTKHFRRTTEVKKNEYLNNLREWREMLRNKYEIERFDLRYKSPDEEVTNITKEMIISETSAPLNENVLDRVDHDSRLLGVAARLREEADMDFGPFVISDHDLLTNIGVNLSNSEETRDIIGGEPIAIQPRGWLNYILAFTPIELGTEAKKEISLGILNSSLDMEEEIDLDQYIHTLTPQVGLEHEDEENLKQFLLSHPLGDELQAAVEDNNLSKAQGISSTILQDDKYIEAVQEKREFQERVKNAQEYAKRKEQEVEKLREGPDREEILQRYINLLSEFNASFPGNVAETQIEPPSEEADVSEIKNWLNTTTAIIQKSDPETVPDEILNMVTDMELLHSDCVKYLN